MRRLMLALCVAACAAGSMAEPALATKVVVDAGHGGTDSGAIGVTGLLEKEVNLDIAAKLKSELVRRGYDAVLTREDDHFISLQGRVDYTNGQNADLFVSVHANWYKKSSTNGSMVLYYDSAFPQADYPASDAMTALTPKSRALAQSVQSSLVAAAGTADLGLTPSAVYVVRMGSVPSILVETAFLSNPADEALLRDPNMRSTMALGIANGVEAWIPPVFPDLAGHWAREAVLRLKAKGIVEGKSTLFDPEGMLTRAEFVTILDRVFNFSQRTPTVEKCSSITGGGATVSNAVYTTSGSTVTGSVYGKPCQPAVSMSDLPATHWAAQTMRKAVELGVIEGYPDSTVRPDRPISREEVAVLLDRMIGAGRAGASGSFTDVPAGSWSADAIYRLKAGGVIDGVSDSQFAPLRSISRAEISAMIDRYLNGKR